MNNDKSLKQKEQLDGYKKASIIKGLLYDYERVLQALTLEQLVKRTTITDSRTRQLKPMYEHTIQEHEMTWGKEYE